MKRFFSTTTVFLIGLVTSQAWAATFEWRVGEWGACSAAVCGAEGTQTRSVQCYRDDGIKVSKARCQGLVKPPSSQSCENKCAPAFAIVSGPSAGSLTQSSAKITWSLSAPGTGQVQYGTTSSYGKVSVLEASFNYSTHIQTLSGLSANTVYHYRVISKNAAGVQIVSVDKTFRTVASLTTTTTQPPVTTTTQAPPPTTQPPVTTTTTQAPPTTTQPPSNPSGFTHFIRPDGGTSAQCNGRANTAYSGSGSNQACAWKSITYAVGMGTAAKIVAGDKVYIESGTYKIGYGQPGAELNSGRCYSSYTPDCTMSAIPSGVTISGNCSNRPKLVGVEGLSTLINLAGKSDVVLQCLDVTDNLGCVDRHNTANGLDKYPCRKTAPYGEWAAYGVYATDSVNVLFDRVKIHGFANNGVNAGRIKDWKFVDSNIDGNGWAGWDGNTGATTSSNSGTIEFLRTSISYNGCVEFPDGSIKGCWGQVSGGYGDGIGTEATGGSWIFDGVLVQGNSSDGIDMLYVKNAGGNVTVKNSYLRNNAGNQVKANQDTVIENNVIVGNCDYHKAFGGTMSSSEYCRASGNAISLGISGSQVATVKNNTVSGEGDCLIITNSSSSGGGGTLNITGNILDGRADVMAGDGAKTCFNYNMATNFTRSVINNLIYNVKEGCISGQVCQDPKFVNPSYDAFNPNLQLGSPGIGLGADLSRVRMPASVP